MGNFKFLKYGALVWILALTIDSILGKPHDTDTSETTQQNEKVQDGSSKAKDSATTSASDESSSGSGLKSDHRIKVQIQVLPPDAEKYPQKQKEKSKKSEFKKARRIQMESLPPINLPADFVCTFAFESLELLRSKCNFTSEIDQILSTVINMAGATFGSRIEPKELKNDENPTNFEKLISSMAKCSAKKLTTTLAESPHERESSNSNSDGKLQELLAPYFEKIHEPDAILLEYLRNASHSKLKKHGMTSASAVNSNEAPPEYSTHVPPTDDEGNEKAKLEVRRLRMDLIGSIIKGSDEIDDGGSPLPPLVPDFHGTPKPALKDVIWDKLKHNPITNLFSNAYKSIKLLFSGLEQTKPAIHHHSNHGYHQHNYAPDTVAHDRTRRRSGNTFDLGGGGGSGGDMDISKVMAMALPLKNLFSNRETSDGDGIKTLKRFLNAALRVYKHTCEPSKKNVAVFKAVATEGLKQLSEIKQVLFVLSNFVDKKVVRAVDACER